MVPIVANKYYKQKVNECLERHSFFLKKKFRIVTQKLDNKGKRTIEQWTHNWYKAT